MNITMKINEYTAAISFNIKLKMFRGEFIESNGSVDFYVYSVADLEK